MTYKYHISKNITAHIEGTELARKQTEHQLLLVIDTDAFGRTLMIGQDENDLCVQFSEKDEAFYHEAVTHPVMSMHPNPKNILIIGGGDGGVAREVLKHDVESITIVDIDEDVVNLTKEYFPELGAHDDERVNLIIGDGKTFIEESDEQYDVIIVDLTDPHGPATQLFTKEFYQTIHDKLTDNGAMIAQTADAVFDPQILGRVHAALRDVFPHAYPYSNFVPSFMVQETYVIGAKHARGNIAETLAQRDIPLRVFTPEQLETAIAQPHPIIRLTLQRAWKPSTIANPATIDSGELLFKYE